MTLTDHWFVRVAVWAYSLGHGADVNQSHAGPREQSLLVRAQDPREALEKAELFTAGILCSPWVWQARITELREAREEDRNARPVRPCVTSVKKAGGGRG